MDGVGHSDEKDSTQRPIRRSQQNMKWQRDQRAPYPKQQRSQHQKSQQDQQGQQQQHQKSQQDQQGQQQHQKSQQDQQGQQQQHQKSQDQQGQQQHQKSQQDQQGQQQHQKSQQDQQGQQQQHQKSQDQQDQQDQQQKAQQDQQQKAQQDQQQKSQQGQQHQKSQQHHQKSQQHQQRSQQRQQQPQPQLPSPPLAQVRLTDDDMFNVKDHTPRVSPYPPCSTWTQRPVEPLFADASDPFGVGHFYAFFHSLLNLAPINIENDRDLQRAAQSPFEKLELWQTGARFDLVYVLEGVRRFRVFIASKKLTRPLEGFPISTGEKNHPIIMDDDRMNFDVLCIFLGNKIGEVKKKGLEM